MGLHLLHRQGMCHIPGAQFRGTATHHQPLIKAQSGGTNLEHQQRTGQLLRALGHLGGTCLTLFGAGKGGTIERSILGYVYPPVVHRAYHRGRGGKHQPVGLHQPLVAMLHAVAVDTIIIVNVGRRMNREVEREMPLHAVGGCHLIAVGGRGLSIFKDVEHQLFAKRCPVWQTEQYFHFQLFRFVVFILVQITFPSDLDMASISTHLPMVKLRNIFIASPRQANEMNNFQSANVCNILIFHPFVRTRSRLKAI